MPERALAINRAPSCQFFMLVAGLPESTVMGSEVTLDPKDTGTSVHGHPVSRDTSTQRALISATRRLQANPKSSNLAPNVTRGARPLNSRAHGRSSLGLAGRDHVAGLPTGEPLRGRFCNTAKFFSAVLLAELGRV